MTVLDVALDGRWADWHGLDPGLDPAALTARFGPARFDTARFDTARFDTAREHGDPLELTPPPPLAGLRAYLSEGRVALVQLDDPVAPGGVAAALTALGPGDLTQPARLGRYGYETTDHVYPRRGLALVVAVAYDHGLPGPAPDRTPRLVRAELFAPADLPAWQAAWGELGATRPPLRTARFSNGDRC